MVARVSKLPPESEGSLQTQVLELAHHCGWRIVHFRPARTAKGWRTAFIGDRGFPDCVLVRRGRLIFAELKRDSEKPDPDQEAWLEALRNCYGVEVHCWRPRDFDAIQQILA